jgi:hypothetical protein
MMFVRVKKIGAYECLYLVENAREADGTFSAWSKRWGVATRSRRPRCVDRQDVAPLRLWSPGFGSDSVRGDPAALPITVPGCARVTRAAA